MKTHLDRPLVVDPRENRNNNTNKTTPNNSDLCYSQHHPANELQKQTCLHEHSGQIVEGGGGGSGQVRPPLEQGESVESRRSHKSEHHRHSSQVRLDTTVIPGPGLEDRPSRRHHHTRSGSRSGGQSEHRKPRSHRKNAENGEEGCGGAGKTGRHKSRGMDRGGGEQDGAGDAGERKPRRNRHGNQTDGEGKRICQHRKKYVQGTNEICEKRGFVMYWSTVVLKLTVLPDIFLCSYHTSHILITPSPSLRLGIAVSLTSLPHAPFKRASLGKAANTVRTWTTLWIPSWSLALPLQKVIPFQSPAVL